MRVLVVGAGIAGLSLSVRLCEAGHDVVVMERHPELRTGGYMIDFFGPGYDAAERMGLLPDLVAIHYPIRHIVFVDRRGRPTADLDYPRLRARMFADRHFNFLRDELERVLYDRVAAAQGTVLFATTPAVIESTSREVSVRDGNGSHDRFDLVVGADGVHSQVRELAFRPADWRFVGLGCQTAAYTFPGTVPGLLPDAFVSMSAAGLTVGAYPIRGDRTATFFVFRSREAIQDRSPDACQKALESAFRGQGWIADPLLDAFPKRADYLFDDVAQVQARTWRSGRVVLLGDAAGCVSLVAGQGASMAMAGAYVLAEELGRHPDDVDAALTRYEARMRPPVEARQRAGRRNAGWFVPGSDFGARWRDRAMGLFMRSPLAPWLGRTLGGGSLPDATRLR